MTLTAPRITNEESRLVLKGDGKDVDQEQKGFYAYKTKSTQRFLTIRRCVLAFIASLVLAGLVVLLRKRLSPPPVVVVVPSRPIYIAYLGNSMIYFNDFPRFFTQFSSTRHNVVQNSCLHGGASIYSLVMEGNGMYPQFMTNASVIDTVRLPNGTSHTIYDFGACTPQQLLTGTDERLNDPGYLSPLDTNDTENLNPCRVDYVYKMYEQSAAHRRSIKRLRSNWDFVLINDNTRNPAKWKLRKNALQMLEQFYLPLLLESDAVPVFLWTHAYSIESTPQRNMSGLEDVANFTSLTYAGYKEYANLLATHLPAKQQPRIAPVGLAFLTVHDENYRLWLRLFHSDHVHASPSGTFLQACIVYYTMFGEMPDKDHVVRGDMGTLWDTARMMQHAYDPPNPMVNRRTAAYLYNVAERIMVHGYKPKSFIDYENGEALMR